MNRLTAALLLLVAIIILPACEQEGSDNQPMEAREYVDGERQLSERSAFAVNLWSESGSAEVGANNFVVRVAFPDATDPMGELGLGVPSAELNLDAWMPNQDMDMQAQPTVSYIGDGQYKFEGVELPAPGIWTLNFTIEVGQTVTEEVEFTFSI